MKTSNKLLLFALVVFLSALATYNIALRAAYKTDRYRDPLRSHTALSLSAFEEVDVNAAHMLHVLIEPGDQHAVYLHNNSKEAISVTQDGNRLTVDVVLSEKNERVGWQGPHVIIRTPNLKVLRSDAVHTENGKTVSNLKAMSNSNKLVHVKGLQQEELQLRLDNGSAVKLSGNTFARLQAVAGSSSGSEPKLLILEDNNIRQANLDIRNRSHLSLQGVAIPELQYNLSEQAQVALSGEALAVLRK